MAYDENMASRLRELTAAQPGVSEMKMFGGLAFLINGNMAVAASAQGNLLLRVAAEDAEELIAQPHVERAVMGGRAMNGWLQVSLPGGVDDPDLPALVQRGVAHAASLPPKSQTKRTPMKKK